MTSVGVGERGESLLSDSSAGEMLAVSILLESDDASGRKP